MLQYSGVIFLRNFWGAVCLSSASAIWGGMYVVSKYVLDYIPPMTLVNIRMVIATLVLWLVLWWSGEKRIAVKDFKEIALIGLIGFTISIGSQFMGTKLSTASLGAIVTSTSPSFMVLFAWLINKERASAAQIIGLVLATIGVLIIAGMGWYTNTEATLTGILFLLIAAITWALYTMLCKHTADRYSSLAVTCYAAMFGTLFTFPITLWELSNHPAFFGDLRIVAGILYLGIVSTALAFYLWNKGFILVPAGTAAVYFFLQPVFGAVLGWGFLGERMTLATLGGAGIILLGVVYSTLVVERIKLIK